MRKDKPKLREVAPGIHRARRSKKGLAKQITFWVSEDEKLRIEQAAATTGVSMSRFVMEKALRAAKTALSQAKARKPSKIKLPRPHKTSKPAL